MVFQQVHCAEYKKLLSLLIVLLLINHLIYLIIITIKEHFLLETFHFEHISCIVKLFTYYRKLKEPSGGNCLSHLFVLTEFIF